MAISLIKIGVPFDTAWDMVNGGMWDEATAYIVAHGEMSGGEFDWDRMTWAEKN